jgi:hypothetical protein
MERDEIQNYRCKFTNTKPSLSGRIDDPCWSEAPFTKDFIDIRGISFPSPKYQTQAKMLYDTEFLYIAAKLQEPQVWTDISLKNSVLYWQNDFEVFLNPLGDAQNYYELEINALNTIWELTITKPYKKGGKAIHPTNIDGLISKVYVDGTLNDPSDVDIGWSVEIAIPLEGLKRYNGDKLPVKGDQWRVNFSRVQWKFEIIDGKYCRVPKENSWDVHYEENWVWSNQSEIDMHNPEKWGIVTFD